MPATAKTADIIIIGGGPAGLAAGIAAAEKLQKQKSQNQNSISGSVIILERNNCTGKKFLLTGSGQCNITHSGSINEFIKHYGSTKKEYSNKEFNKEQSKKEHFVKPALFNFDNTATLIFFEQNGVPLREREDGKVFPQSLKASDLLNVLLNKFKEYNGKIDIQTEVQIIHKTESGFILETNQGIKTANRIILATGGSSYPATGSDGSGFDIAAALGHRIVPPKPALTPVYVQNYRFAECAGISFDNADFYVKRSGRKTKSGSGIILLTHRGLSGPAILDSSRFIEPLDIISVNFMPIKSAKERYSIQQFLTGKKTVKNALRTLNLPERFLEQLLTAAEITADKPAAEISREERKRIEDALMDFPFVVESLGNWNEAMATAGGIALEEVNRQTLESRIVPDLFFCGEVLDIDGGTGGYNLQFALSSGFFAGKNAIQTVK